VRVTRTWLRDFRSHVAVEVEWAPGINVVTGDNGLGKTNLVEAVVLLSRLESFRGAPTEAMIRLGAEAAVVRGEVVREGRDHLIELELPRHGRSRVQVDRQRVQRRSDVARTLVTSVFSPDDLDLVKAGPAARRGFLDEVLVTRSARHEQGRAELDRVIRQRNALLKGLHGRLDDAAAVTLDVWDQRLADLGERWAAARDRLVAAIAPDVDRAYEEVSQQAGAVELGMVHSWAGQLGDALAASRTDEVRRGVTLTGPHRDDLVVTLNGMPARTHASQGEQRCLALALKVAAHRYLAEDLGVVPVLVLDDVFSELDPSRSAALTAALPDGQVIVTSAMGVPDGAKAERVLRVVPEGVEVVV
jgi:DNA replication and repair protein RecF